MWQFDNWIKHHIQQYNINNCHHLHTHPSLFKILLIITTMIPILWWFVVSLPSVLHHIPISRWSFATNHCVHGWNHQGFWPRDWWKMIFISGMVRIEQEIWIKIDFYDKKWASNHFWHHEEVSMHWSCTS